MKFVKQAPGRIICEELLNETAASYGKILWAYEGSPDGIHDIYGEEHANTRREAMRSIKAGEGWSRWPKGVKIWEIGLLRRLPN